MPRWLDSSVGAQAGERKRRSVAAEKRLADRLGGRTTTRSGARVSRFGRVGSGARVGTEGHDIRFGKWVAEHKMTVRESLSLKRQWLHQLLCIAREKGSLPVLLLTFSSTDGRNTEDYAVIRLSDFETLLDRE